MSDHGQCAVEQGGRTARQEREVVDPGLGQSVDNGKGRNHGEGKAQSCEAAWSAYAGDAGQVRCLQAQGVEHGLKGRHKETYRLSRHGPFLGGQEFCAVLAWSAQRQL